MIFKGCLTRVQPFFIGKFAMFLLRAPFTLGALVVIAGCGGGDAPDPASLPRDEAQALNDAASLLNSRDDTPPNSARKAQRP